MASRTRRLSCATAADAPPLVDPGALRRSATGRSTRRVFWSLLEDLIAALDFHGNATAPTNHNIVRNHHATPTHATKDIPSAHQRNGARVGNSEHDRARRCSILFRPPRHQIAILHIYLKYATKITQSQRTASLISESLEDAPTTRI